MKNILVTGSNGQLGNEIRKIESENNIFNFIFTDVEELDITNKNSVDAFFNENKIDYVINCAAFTNVDGAESDIMSEKINIEGVKNLAENTQKHNSYIIHISTDYVYGGDKTTPYSEKEKTNPKSAYGKTKLLGENTLLENDKYIIIRTSWLYSEFGNNFVKTMLRLSKTRDSISVVFDQIGSPTYAADLAKVIMQIVNKVDKQPNKYPNGIFNYSNEGVCSWYDFAVEIMKFSKRNCVVFPIESKEFPTPAKRPNYSVLNKFKIKNTFDIEIAHWRESLEELFSILK